MRVKVKGVLVTHGELGHACVRVVERLLGTQDALGTVSNTGLSPDALRRAIEDAVKALGEGGELFLFNDLDGGSCANVCTRIAVEHEGCFSISGLNLPMLLEFCHYRERLSGEALAERVTRKGRDGIAHVPDPRSR